MTSDESSAGTDQPGSCQNPEADCYRSPTRLVWWGEDHTSDNPENKAWLCTPCFRIFERGMRVAPSEYEVLAFAE